MKIHYSTYEENDKWINVSKQLPTPNKKVQLAYIHFSDWNLEFLMWETTGWFKRDNIWSIKIGEKQNKEDF